MLSPNNIPNILTVLRILMIAPIIWAIADGQYLLALGLVFIAGASDGLDGFLARRFGWTSDLGAMLDPLADKLMLVSAYLALSYTGLVPWWLTFAIIMRDIIIVIGAIIYHISFDELEINPSYVSKINTFFQIALALVVIFNAAFPIISPEFMDIGFYVVLTTTFISGADYIWTWGLKAMKGFGHADKH
jgi:cardiolipin synthase (CMP-forming)